MLFSFFPVLSSRLPEDVLLLSRLGRQTSVPSNTTTETSYCLSPFPFIHVPLLLSSRRVLGYFVASITSLVNELCCLAQFIGSSETYVIKYNMVKIYIMCNMLYIFLYRCFKCHSDKQSLDSVRSTLCTEYWKLGSMTYVSVYDVKIWM